MRKRRETLRVVGEFVLMVVLALAVLELLVLGTARAAANAKQLREENATLISQPTADSFPLKGEADGRTEASAPTGAGTEIGFEVTDFELCVNW